MRISSSPTTLTVSLAALLAAHVIHAQTDGSWIVNDSGDWSDASNWSSDPAIPGGAGSTVSIDAAITANRTVTIDTTDRTVGTLNIGSTDFRRYFLESSGGAALIFDNDGDDAVLNFLSSGNANTITAPLVLNSNLIVNNQASNDQLIIAESVSSGSAGAKTIFHTGTGTGTVEYRITDVDNSSGNIGLSVSSTTSTFFLAAPGSDQVTLNFDDGISVDGGHLSLRFNISLGANSLYLNNAALSRPGTTGGSSASGNVSLGGTVDYNLSGTGNLTLSGDVQLHADTILGVHGGHLAISAPISGDFSLTKTGDNQLSLTTGGAKTFSGGFIQDGGSTVAANATNLLGTGPITLRSGNLRLGNFTVGLNFGNNVIVDGDAMLTSARSNSGGSGSMHTLGTLEIGSNTLTMTPAVSETTSGIQGFNFGTTTVTGNAVLNILNSTNDIASGKIALGALNGAGNLTKDGEGILELTAAAGSYAGTTTVLAGTVDLANASALGTGTLQINGGTVTAPSGAALSNTAIFLAGGGYTKNFANAENFANYLTATSNFDGGITTSATFLDGAAGGVRTVATAFASAPDTPVSNDGIRASEVFTLSGTNADIFALQIAIDSVSTSHFLGWVEDGVWVNAVDGNSATGSSALQGFLGSYAAAEVSATADFLGSWGVDTDTDSVWAILDHNSEFAVIPDPPAMALLFAVCTLAITALRRRRADA